MGILTGHLNNLMLGYWQIMEMLFIRFTGHEDINYSGRPYGPPVNYLVVNSIKEKSFVLINVNRNDITVEEIFF